MKSELFYTHKIRNFFQTLIILASMTLIIALLGWMLAGRNGIIFALLVGVIISFVSPHISPRLILKSARAHQLSPYEYNQLYQITKNLCLKAGLKHMPSLYRIPNNEMNAFAVGRGEDAAIGITDGLLRSLNSREIAGIIGHEIGHIKNNDLRVIGFADIAGRITHSLSTIGQIIVLTALTIGGFQFSLLPLLILIVAPTVSVLLQLALSRTREFEADLVSAQLTGDAYGLASALKKLEAYQQSFWKRLLIPSWSSPPSLFMTHPPTKERIERLISLGGQHHNQHLPQMQPVLIGNKSNWQPVLTNRYMIRPRWY